MTPYQEPKGRKSVRLFLTGIAAVLIALALCGITYSVFYQGTGQIVSSAVTAPPFIVKSTTTVSNLNADLLNGQNGTYYNDTPGKWSCTLRTNSCSCGSQYCDCDASVSCTGAEAPIWWADDESYQTAGSIQYYFTSGQTVYCHVWDTPGNGYASYACWLECCL